MALQLGLSGDRVCVRPRGTQLADVSLCWLPRRQREDRGVGYDWLLTPAAHLSVRLAGRGYKWSMWACQVLEGELPQVLCVRVCVSVCVCQCVCQCVCVHVLNKAAASGANVLPAVKHLLVALNQVVGAQRNLRRASRT